LEGETTEICGLDHRASQVTDDLSHMCRYETYCFKTIQGVATQMDRKTARLLFGLIDGELVTKA
jgi:hypothetical protein